MSNRRHTLVRVGLSLALAAAPLTVLSGCSPWNLRGEGFPEQEQRLTEGYRQRERDNQRWGYSTKAQQIESNLGVGQ